MKAMILAAGLGTRLKPWTLHHPKALVPVGGVPMLERVILRLKEQRFNDLVINIHHFGEQIIDFIRSNNFGVKISISDERDLLMDTGGGILKAAPLLGDREPFLIHNVDILSDADLGRLMQCHIESRADATLLVSNRDSSRKLIADKADKLVGWENLKTGELRRRRSFDPHQARHVSFSGIHVISPSVFADMLRDSHFSTGKPFPVMDYYLSTVSEADIRVSEAENLRLIDIGKPETLSRANDLFRTAD